MLYIGRSATWVLRPVPWTLNGSAQLQLTMNYWNKPEAAHLRGNAPRLSPDPRGFRTRAQLTTQWSCNVTTLPARLARWDRTGQDRTSHRLWVWEGGHMFLLLIGFNFTGPTIWLAHFVGIGWSNGKWEAHLSRRFEFCCCPFLFRIPIPIVWGALWRINFKNAFWVFLRVYFSGKHAAVCFNVSVSVSVYLSKHNPQSQSCISLI